MSQKKYPGTQPGHFDSAGFNSSTPVSHRPGSKHTSIGCLPEVCLLAIVVALTVLAYCQGWINFGF